MKQRNLEDRQEDAELVWGVGSQRSASKSAIGLFESSSIAFATLAVVIALLYLPVTLMGRSNMAPLLLNKRASNVLLAGHLRMRPKIVPDYRGRTPTPTFNIDLATPAFFEAPINRLLGDFYKHWQIPLWNPYQGTGVPLLGQYNTRALFPYQVLEDLSPSTWWDFFMLGRLWLAAAFTYLFIRRISNRGDAAVLGALFYSLSGSFTWFINLEEYANGAMVLPLLLWTLDRMIVRQNGSDVLLATFASVLALLVGQPEVSFFILVFGFLYTCFRIFFSESGWKRPLTQFFAQSTVAIAIASPQILPFIGLVKQGDTTHAAVARLALANPTPFSWLASIILPATFNSKFSPPNLPINGVWDWLGGYIGILTFVLAFTGFFLPAHQRKKFALFFSLVTLVVLLKNIAFPYFMLLGAIPISSQAWGQRWAGPIWTFAAATSAATTISILVESWSSSPMRWCGRLSLPNLFEKVSGVMANCEVGNRNEWLRRATPNINNRRRRLPVIRRANRSLLSFLFLPFTVLPAGILAAEYLTERQSDQGRLGAMLLLSVFLLFVEFNRLRWRQIAALGRKMLLVEKDDAYAMTAGIGAVVIFVAALFMIVALVLASGGAPHFGLMVVASSYFPIGAFLIASPRESLESLTWSLRKLSPDILSRAAFVGVLSMATIFLLPFGWFAGRIILTAIILFGLGGIFITHVSTWPEMSKRTIRRWSSLLLIAAIWCVPLFFSHPRWQKLEWLVFAGYGVLCIAIVRFHYGFRIGLESAAIFFDFKGGNRRIELVLLLAALLIFVASPYLLAWSPYSRGPQPGQVGSSIFGAMVLVALTTALGALACRSNLVLMLRDKIATLFIDGRWVWFVVALGAFFILVGYLLVNPIAGPSRPLLLVNVATALITMLIFASIWRISATQKQLMYSIFFLATVELWLAIPCGYSPDGEYLKLIPWLLGICAVVAVALSRPKTAAVGFCMAILAFAAIDRYALHGLPSRVDIFTPPNYVKFLKQTANKSRVVGLGGMLMPNYSSAYGLYDVRYINSVTPASYRRFANDYLMPQTRIFDFQWYTGNVSAFDNPVIAQIRNSFLPNSRGLDLLGVKYVVVPGGAAKAFVEEATAKAWPAETNVPGRPASIAASDSWSAQHSALEMVDNNRLTYWSDKIGPQSPKWHWIGFSFAKPLALRSIALLSRKDMPSQWWPSTGYLLQGTNERVNKRTKWTSLAYMPRPRWPLVEPGHHWPEHHRNSQYWFKSCILSTREFKNYRLLTRVAAPLSIAELRAVPEGVEAVPENGDQCDEKRWRPRGLGRELKIAYQDKSSRVFENQNAFPRAFVARDLMFAKNYEKAQDLAMSPAFDLRHRAIVEQKVPDMDRGWASRNSVPVSAAEATEDIVKITKYLPDVVKIKVHISRPGLLVLTDLWTPAWRASVDGHAARLYRVDGLVRGVWLKDGGIHSVTMKYAPYSWETARYLASGGLLVSFMFLIFWRKRKGDRSVPWSE